MAVLRGVVSSSDETSQARRLARALGLYEVMGRVKVVAR